MALIPAILTVNPGLKLRITQNGLNYAATQAIKLLKLEGKTFPDTHESKYDITNVRIQSFVTPHSSLTIEPGSGIHYTGSKYQTHWQLALPHQNWIHSRY